MVSLQSFALEVKRKKEKKARTVAKFYIILISSLYIICWLVLMNKY